MVCVRVSCTDVVEVCVSANENVKPSVTVVSSVNSATLGTETLTVNFSDMVMLLVTVEVNVIVWVCVVLLLPVTVLEMVPGELLTRFWVMRGWG